MHLYKLYNTLLAIVLCFTGLTQSKKVGDKEFSQFHWEKALKIYESLNKKDISIRSNIAYCYKKLSKYNKASDKYREFIEKRKAPQSDYFEYAEVLNMQGKYKEAIEYYSKVPSSFNKKYNVKGRIKNAYWAIENKETKSSLLAKKTTLNLNGKSFGKALYEDGMIYSYKSNENNYYLAFSRIENKEKIGEVTDFAPNLKNDFFSVSPAYAKGILYYSEPTNRRNSDLSKGTLGLFYSVNDKSWKWTQPKGLPVNSTVYNCTQPSVTRDGKTIYFASDMPGGYGKYDIYTMKKQANGSWSKPINLGNEVNTVGDENYPFIVDNVLYFSSKEHPGFGGFDVFVCEKGESGWSMPFNLGKGINSPQNDFGIVFDEKGINGYLSSDRDGKDDVYYLRPDLVFDYIPTKVVSDVTSSGIFEPRLLIKHPKIGEREEVGSEGDIVTLVPTKGTTELTYYADGYKPKTIIINLEEDKKNIKTVRLEPRMQGVIKNNFSNEPLAGVTVSINERSTGKELASTVTDNTGKWYYILPDDIDYEIVLTGGGKKKRAYVIKARESLKEVERIIEKSNRVVRVGEKVKLKNIYFEQASHKIKRETYKTLDNVVRVLKELPTMEIELSAHTDMVGSEDYNLRLSRKRARSVRDYIVSKGISKRRLQYKGYGEKYILNRCTSYRAKCSEEEYAVSRRVEIKVLKN